MITHIVAYKYSGTSILFSKGFNCERNAVKWVEGMLDESDMWTLERVGKLSSDLGGYESTFISSHETS